jgi:hypothetical protein
MLVMTLLVRNEEDILHDNIDFHLSMGVDHVIATDNLSTDSTPSILKSYERRGQLTYIREESDTYDQSEWVTRMARMAYTEFEADWVINNDADEFWWPLQDISLETCFEAISPGCNVATAFRHNFVAIRHPENGSFRKMVYREKESLNALGKPLPPKVAHRGSQTVEVAQGNHSVSGMGDIISIENKLEILHYPVRTYAQLINKITNGGSAYERNTKFAKGIGQTWRHLYSELQSKGNLLSYFQQVSADPDQIQERLEKQTLTLDTRLVDYLTTLNQ